jgi:hypothetical protein
MITDIEYSKKDLESSSATLMGLMLASDIVSKRGQEIWGNLDVEVAHVEGVVLDEPLAGLDDVAHKDVEHLVRFDGVVLVEADAEELADFGVHGGFEELLGVHFTESFEALDLDAASGDFENLAEDFRHGENRGDLLLVAVALEDFEDRGVIIEEDRGIDAALGETGKDAGDGVGLVEFVQVRAAGWTAVGGQLFFR